MKIIFFPDGQSILVPGIQKFALQTKKGGLSSVWWSMTATNVWSKANTFALLSSERVIYDIMEEKVVQSIAPGQRAIMPGKYRC